jgi:tripartite motif-containing protein 71
MKLVFGNKLPRLIALAALGLCLAAVLALTPQTARAQSNILDYELEFGKVDGFFHAPQGVAVDQNGNVYVSDYDDARIQVFDSSGNFVRKWGWHGTDAGELRQPVGVAVDDALGRVYVADMGNNRIQVFDMVGNYQFEFGGLGSLPGQLDRAHDVAFTNRAIYVADTWNYRIQVFDLDGNFITEWGSFGSGNGQFDGPKALAIHRDVVYVADSGNNRVQAFDSRGAFLFAFGTAGSALGQFNMPSGIAVNASGVYVADSGNHRVQVFDHAGTALDAYGALGTSPRDLNTPMGLASASDNGYMDIYIADSLNHRVVRWDKTSSNIPILGSVTAPDGHLTQPMGIAHSERIPERLFVADFGNNRIQVFSLEGDFLYGWTLNQPPVDVAIDPKDYHVWVATQPGTVHRFDINGNFINSWTPPAGPNPGEIGVVKGINVDGEQHVYLSNQWVAGGGGNNVANGRIHIYTANGTYLTEWGATGLSTPNPPALDTFQLPDDLELTKGGRQIFVAVTGQYRVKQIGIGANGSFNGGIEHYSGTQRAPKAVAIGPAEFLLVSDKVGRLSIYEPFNNLVYQQDRFTGGGPGEFRNIGDMEYTPASREYPELLIFSEWENHRIQVFSLDW